jgi:restriction endonuclease Mrr
MDGRRADRIRQCLQTYAGGRARVQELLERIRSEERNSDLPYQSIYIAIQQENQHLEELGERTIFITSREGEERGWVRLRETSDFAKDSPAAKLEAEILATNESVGSKIRAWLQKMDWRTFESTFLTRVLEALGFQDVQITQPTRDGGADARVTYRRGIVEARAIVSAKRWSTRSVGLDEVQRLRGLKGDEDTAIIVTTGQFSQDAEKEARPGQNQRVVYLVDGEKLIDICTRNRIGVKKVTLPDLLVLDDELSGESAGSDSGDEEPGVPVSVQAPGEAHGMRRLRDEMLGDSERGLSVEEVANLSGLTVSTVRAYLSDERRKMLGQRIRADDHARVRALQIVFERRVSDEDGV